MKPIIRIEGLGKQYRIGARQAGYGTLREALVNAARAPLRWLRRRQASAPATIWALRDVTLEVFSGEIVGVVGRNGAGKSTLLKVLSRITEPTTGRAEIYGRIGSLLEVGTGFHPELTGRENIYLNGAILGLRRQEIAGKFDAIVGFAEIDRFLDTPVKQYSSGMYLRLAFAVAAHLETEILLVDEVLTVGDAAFQKKCLGKMGEVAHAGRTVLFVSHQPMAVRMLCSRAIELESGKVVADGDVATVVEHYLRGANSDLRAERLWEDMHQRPGDEQFQLTALRVLAATEELRSLFRSSESLFVEMEFELTSVPSALCVGFDLLNQHGIVVCSSFHNDRAELEWPVLRRGRNRLRCALPQRMLNRGVYYVVPRVGLHNSTWIVHGEEGVAFRIQLDHSGSPYWSVHAADKLPGVIAPCLLWQTHSGSIERVPIETIDEKRGEDGSKVFALFLDRDGTLIEDVGYPRDPRKVRLLPGAGASLARLRKEGYRLVLVSNQSGIGRGLVTAVEAEAVHVQVLHTLAEHGVELDGAYYCPHAPAERCRCRKPSPAMLCDASRDLGVELVGSFMVGDKPSDMEAGRRAGCGTIFLAAGLARAECPTPADFVAASWSEIEAHLVSAKGRRSISP